MCQDFADPIIGANSLKCPSRQITANQWTAPASVDINQLPVWNGSNASGLILRCPLASL